MSAAHSLVHAAPCQQCPSAHHEPDEEAAEYARAPRLVRLAALFPCAWRPTALCRGVCDRHGFGPADVANGEVMAARAELAAIGACP